MDLVWLKRGDVRLHDHGPISTAAQSGRPWAILFVYESDQLAHHSVHGSHVEFCNEGLIDLEERLNGLGNRKRSLSLALGDIRTVLNDIHKRWPLRRIMSHQESGHITSYARDKRVRKWCRSNSISFIEFQQTGVTRMLRNRDNFSKEYNAFMSKMQHVAPHSESHLQKLQWLGEVSLDQVQTPNQLIAAGLCLEYPQDREDRQRGGESRGIKLLESFLLERAKSYSKGISSPLLSWTSCSRLSPYLSFGQVSLRHVVQALNARLSHLAPQHSLRQPLMAFYSRLRWRSHFIQKLESEPEIEHRAMCPAFQGWQESLWNEAYYQAWATGQTGYVMVDACMRCLLRHGWVNFRMRAMLVSFACYNLWLDWRRIAPHLARCFLDYEPGIHYPQLQMQAGTTGINAMRVYNVVKQGQDQDPRGVFIRKYIPELKNVPSKFIHEPHRMPLSVQRACGTVIAKSPKPDMLYHYPPPIVDAQERAKQSKARMAAVRKDKVVTQQAQQVYLKHGSRMKRTSDFHKMHGALQKPKQPKLFAKAASNGAKERHLILRESKPEKLTPKQSAAFRCKEAVAGEPALLHQSTMRQLTLSGIWQAKNSASFINCITGRTLTQAPSSSKGSSFWTCKHCTVRNTKLLAPVCEVCLRPK